MSAHVVVDGVEIRQDQYGRFCLNDLHRASGGEQRHRPKYWLENQKTTDLIELLEAEGGNPPIWVQHGGSESGTYVGRELVYDYAAWVSPAFRLKVYRVFDAIVTGRSLAAPSDMPSDPRSLRKALIRAEEEKLKAWRELDAAEDERERLAAEVAAQAPKVEVYERLLTSGDARCLRDAAKELCVPERELIDRLLTERRLFRNARGELRAYASECEAGRFRHRTWTAQATSKSGTQVLVTTVGLAWLATQLAARNAVSHLVRETEGKDERAQ